AVAGSGARVCGRSGCGGACGDTACQSFPRELTARGAQWRFITCSIVSAKLSHRKFLISKIKTTGYKRLRLSVGRLRVEGVIFGAGVATTSDDGLTPGEQIGRVDEVAGELIADQQRVWVQLRRELRESGIVVLGTDELSDGDRTWLESDFRENMFPVLTPLA